MNSAQWSRACVLPHGISKIATRSSGTPVFLLTSSVLTSGILDVDLLTMTTPQILELLYSFNTFSPEFTRCLDRLIQSDKEDRYLSSLQGPELTRLVDFLDRVRVLLSTSFPPAYEKTLQALGIIPVTEDVSRRCLHKLQAVCSHHGILPSSHIISGGLVRVGDYPVASTNLSDVWEGTHGSTKVCIKHPRITIKDRKHIEKVSDRGIGTLILPSEVNLSVDRHSTRRRSCGKG